MNRNHSPDYLASTRPFQRFWTIGRFRKLRLQRVYGQCRRNRSGVAAVEFAVVAPVFVVFVMGLIEVSRGIMMQQVVTNAAREGARAAVLDGSTVSSVQSVVRSYLTAANVPSTVGTITVTIPATRYNNSATVNVSVPYSSVSWVPIPRYLGSMNLTSSASMRCEAVSTSSGS